MHRCALLWLLLLSAPVLSAAPELTQWRSGLIELDEGWRAHAGDNPAWAAAEFDDRAWPSTNVENLGPVTPEWHWLRKRIIVGPEYEDVRLLISGGDGTYELYVNGTRMEGPRIKSSFGVSRPTERVFDLNDPRGEFVIALRTYAPPNYSAYHLPLFLSITLGQPTAIEYERQALESERMYAVLPSIAINLLLCAGGLVGLALYRSQSAQREYLFLGLFLLAVGAANCLWIPQQAGILPTSTNYWIADPLIYVFAILQIEFTFSFARMRLNRAWRVYEFALLSPLALIPFVWEGHFSFDVYTLIEAVIILPAALLLPVFLLVWYRRGNREAGWLIFPSLLPALTLFLFNLGGSFASMFGWARFAVLLQPIPVGPAELQMGDLGNLVFLFAIGFVMFFRFTRVSREQARTAAELDAAREIQRRLVPAQLPAMRGCKIEAAYFPAQEVGGDFYQILDQPDGTSMVVIGDVSGKGLKAAMTGTLAIGALRALAAEGLRPSELLSLLNRELLRGGDGGFITCLCVQLSRAGILTLANAGHLAPYVNGCEVECIPGLPLGIAETEYAETTVRIAPGDRLTLLSDGVVEARNKKGELFGFERTQTLSRERAEQIARAAQAFGQDDDITVLTVVLAPAGVSW